VSAADVATTTPPHTSAVRAGTSAACAASLMDCLAMGAPAPVPGAVILRRSPPPLPRPTTSTLKSPGERVPAARAVGTPHPSVPGAPVAGSSSPSCALPALAPAVVLLARARSRGMGRSDCAASTITICRGRAKDQTSPVRRGQIEGERTENPLTCGP
jgi:hypothetical protein